MKKLDAHAGTYRWLRRPLCRRYAVVVFGTFSKLKLGTEPNANRTICWAFGTLLNGDSEILGAWHSDTNAAIPPEVFGQLYHRGIEFVRCGLGDLAGVEPAFMAAFRNSATCPSIEQTLAATLADVKAGHRSAMSRLLRAKVGDPIDAIPTVSSPDISSAELRERYPKLTRQWDEAVALFRHLFALPEPYRRLVRSVDRAAAELRGRLERSIHRHGPFVDSDEAFDFVVAGLRRADLQLDREARAAQHARDASAWQFRHRLPTSDGAVGTATLAYRVLP
jgi:transposase-like protein